MASSSLAATSSSTVGPHYHRSRFGDTTHTRIFVGGLAWEIPSEGLGQHFGQFGEILEAVVITDRYTGRSKGYGFVTFRDSEAARRAVAEPNPVIGGRRANCNIALLGPPRPARLPRGWISFGPSFHGPSPSPDPHFSRVPSQLPPHAPMFYNSQFGYWTYPSDYTPYQQGLYNAQMNQQFYPQLYGPTSPSTPPYHLMGYMPNPRAAGLQSLHQGPRPPFIQQLTAQVEGSFAPSTSIPPNFRLQLPSHVTRQNTNITDSQSNQPSSEEDKDGQDT